MEMGLRRFDMDESDVDKLIKVMSDTSAVIEAMDQFLMSLEPKQQMPQLSFFGLYRNIFNKNPFM
jgi:hypothetical protein